jgi:hypothetical protein
MGKVLVPIVALLSLIAGAAPAEAKKYPRDEVMTLKCEDGEADFIYKLERRFFWKVAVNNGCARQWIHVHWTNGKKTVDLIVSPGQSIDLWKDELKPLPTRTAKRFFVTPVSRPCERLSRKADYWVDDDGLTRYNCYL